MTVFNISANTMDKVLPEENFEHKRLGYALKEYHSKYPGEYTSITVVIVNPDTCPVSYL